MSSTWGHWPSMIVAALILLLGPPAHRGMADETERAVELARKTLVFVEQTAPRPGLAAELAALEKRIADAKAASAGGGGLLAEVRRLRRRIIFSHPLLDFDKLLVNKRPPPGYSHQSRQYLGRYSRPGPGLAVLQSWKDGPKETVLLKGKLPGGTVMHPDLSFDARRVVFSFCDHSPQDPNLRQFFLWEVGIDGSELRQLTGTASDVMIRSEGRQSALVEDFDPCYLPDGGIAFVSTRSQTHIRCQYGFRYFANFLLYRAQGDGSNIEPLSFAEAPEWEPSVLDDGRILYTRWDYTNRHSYHFQSPWVTRPDGTGTADFYGNHTRNPCNTAEPRQVPGSQKIVCTAAAHHGYTAGSIVLVDPRKGIDGLAPLERITPEVAFPETEGWPLEAYATPFALSEDLFLAAYTPEPLVREGKVQSVAAYGIYLVDRFGGRELIYHDPGMSCFAPIPIRPRPRPPVLSPAREEKALPTGVFFVKDVYQATHPVAPGSVKSLRVVRIFPQTIETPPSRSITPYEMPKQIVGTAPVGEDGSVAFRAPAGQPLFFQLVDGNGMALMTMRALVYLQPGEIIGCVGCHEPRHVAPGGLATTAGRKVHDLRPPSGPRYEGGLSFARTVQPVLDRYCIDCHGLEKTEADLNLLGTLEPVTFPRKQWPGPNKNMIVSLAYRSLVTREGLVKVAHADMETDYGRPKDYFAHAGRLAGTLLQGHRDLDGRPRVELDRESFQRIADWLDVNAVYYGGYSWNKPEWRKASPKGEATLRKHILETFGSEWAKQPLAALINVSDPAQSRILMAPLAVSAGGWGQIHQGGWSDTEEPGYQEMRRAVQAAIAPLEHHDVAGTCGREPCLCDSCWVRRAREARQKPPE